MSGNRKQRETGPSPAPLAALVTAAPFLAGLYYEWGAALAALYLLALLLCWQRRYGLRLRGSPALLFAAAPVLVLLLSPLWAVDRGMAPLGVLKVLPLPLFTLALEQLPTARREELLQPLPYGGAVMVLLSSALCALPGLRPLLWVDGRLAGLFQYPNTFALYLLLGAAWLLLGEKLGKREGAVLLVLVLGIALSGSRTVLLLLLALLLFCLVWDRRRARRRLALTLGGGLVGLALGYVLLTGSRAGLGRLLSLSLRSSSFLGRLLYARDALPQILTHPLGLGYWGYAWRQGSFQTGVYSVLHVHNDFLQLLLDAGWLPGALLLWALIRGLRRGNLRRRVLLVLFCLHCLLDFDCQYTAMVFLLLTLMDREEPGGRPLPRPAALGAAWALGAFAVYFGLTALLGSLGSPAARRLYPAYTQSLLTALEESGDGAEAETLADRILALNDSARPAWAEKARAALRRGDVTEAVACQERLIALKPYERQSYLDYVDLLQAAWRICQGRGDPAGAALCREKLSAVPESMAAAEARTSRLGRLIQDQPELTLPPGYAGQRLEG